MARTDAAKIHEDVLGAAEPGRQDLVQPARVGVAVAAAIVEEHGRVRLPPPERQRAAAWRHGGERAGRRQEAVVGAFEQARVRIDLAAGRRHYRRPGAWWACGAAVPEGTAATISA
ncbi:MAG: hypothetical protein ABIT71_01520, partial [Vicinamibacteraceae bacterium]